MKECKRYLPLFLCLLALLVAGSGCSIGESDYPEGGGATTWELCDHTWEANYSLDDGTLVNHQIIFYTGGQGEESLLYNYYGEVWEEYYTFYWRWANSLQNSIALSYPGGGTLYMDHVYIKLDLFSCLLDGMFVTFREK
ncbi:hypothetical protein H7U35_01735 [Mediterranea massiliensis]|uniref:Lipocalin-like domain-containing protein n=1 Tax=Mediterranea massiliensis TaxID=1841865 RepID=A0ABS2DYA5_9BACT|nr:hypothetical protein [Mediterranea massiliensis]MBM6733949.1 hypothetical protein [Mediterranea massiliensis]